MDFKKIFNSLFAYTPPVDYQFNLTENSNIDNSPSDGDGKNILLEDSKKVFSSLQVNLEFMQTIYNSFINSDVILRQFTINARGKQYHAFIAYIDGMVDSQILNEFILEPLMLRNRNNLFEGSQNKVISEAVTNNITVRKVKKFDLSNYLMNCLMPQNSIKESSEFSQIISGINSRKLCSFCRYFKCCF